MSTDYDGKLIKCPYWRCRSETKITCRGLIEGTMVTWSFGSLKEARKQEIIFCQDMYKRCEMCLSIERFRNLDGERDGK